MWMFKASLTGVLVLSFHVALAAPSLERGFRNPPDSAKPHTWYHMIYGEYPSFDEILSTIKKLESEINSCV